MTRFKNQASNNDYSDAFAPYSFSKNAGDIVARREEPQDFVAVRQIIQLLRPLSEEHRRRVLRTTATFFGLDMSAEAPAPVSLPSNSQTYFEERKRTPASLFEPLKNASVSEQVLFALQYLHEVRGQRWATPRDVSELLREAGIEHGNVRSAVSRALKNRLVSRNDAGGYSLTLRARNLLTDSKQNRG